MKTKIIIIAITVLLSTSILTAQTYGHADKKLDSDYFGDGWNYIHLLGTSTLVTVGRCRFNMTPLQAGIAAFTINAFWDVGDEIYRSLRKGPSSMDKVFDPAGWDWRDVFVMGAAGAITGNLVVGFEVKRNVVMASVTLNLN